jgi:hypothetical protein
MIAKMIELIPDQRGLFRNIFPEATQAGFRSRALVHASDAHIGLSPLAAVG